jgi:hypothetical protein
MAGDLKKKLGCRPIAVYLWKAAFSTDLQTAVLSVLHLLRQIENPSTTPHGF